MKPIMPYIFILTLTSCSYGPKITYEGDQLPDNQVAVVVVPSNSATDYTVVYYDGQRRGAGLFDEYHFLPGEHTMTFGANRYGYLGSHIKVSFNAKAGDRYLASGWIDLDNMKWGVSLLDINVKDALEKNTTNVENRVNLKLH